MRSSEASTSGNKPVRRRGFIALTALLFLGVSVFMAEAFLRLRWTPPHTRSNGAFGPHPVYATAPLPGASGRQVTVEYDKPFQISRHGFRGPLPELSTPATRPRLLVLGDSQTFGLGCGEGETFCDRLREELPRVEVLNTGSNGYGTREELSIVHHLGAAWEPDIVMLVFFWNDLEDNTKRSAPAFELDSEQHVARLDDYSTLFEPLALCTAVQSPTFEQAGMLLPQYLKEGLRGLRYRTLGMKRRSIRSEEQLAAAWRVSAELLGLMKRRVDEIGAELLVVYLPDHNQIDPDAVIRNIDPLNFEVQERLFEVCDGLDIRHLDLRDALLRSFASSDESLYYYADRHLTPHGHAVVSEAMLAALPPEWSAL